MVIEYLIHNCFKNTAKALLTETSKLENCTSILQTTEKQKKGLFSDYDAQWTLLDARKSLTDAIERGDILEAFELIKKYFPSFAAYDVVPNGIPPPNDPEGEALHMVLFKLKCQRFVEIIRSSTSTSSMEALRYAQTHLKAPQDALKEKVNEVTALIAYTDPHQSRSKHLLSQERRDQLATEVNNVLLAQCNLPVQTSIEKISRQYSVVSEELHKTNKGSLDHTVF
ncbi:unnamed protein product [Mucor hiemalis]